MTWSSSCCSCSPRRTITKMLPAMISATITTPTNATISLLCRLKKNALRVRLSCYCSAASR